MKIDLRNATALAPFLSFGRKPASKTTRKAEEDQKAEGEEDPMAEGEDPKAEGTEDPKAEDGGDPEAEDDEEGNPVMDGKEARAAALKERQRIQAILSHQNAAANPGVAMKLAFETSLSVKAAHAVLDGAQAPAKTGLKDRMAGLEAHRPGPGGAPQPTGSAAIQTGWAAVYKGLTPPGR